eukprot:scaffold2706_cov109-Isochrysis_galbana.AAC.2
MEWRFGKRGGAANGPHAPPRSCGIAIAASVPQNAAQGSVRQGWHVAHSTCARVILCGQRHLSRDGRESKLEGSAKKNGAFQEAPLPRARAYAESELSQSVSSTEAAAMYSACHRGSWRV